MTVPLIVAASEWLAARKELLAAEAQAASALEAVTARRRELPAVPVAADITGAGSGEESRCAGDEARMEERRLPADRG
jgi:predicted dithiol-disulfide oxidoreductase (DUF899 family)